jgi:acyl-coenzyme A thioesterase PaaI-like protein
MSRLGLIRETLALRLWAFSKIRLIAYVRPRVVDLTDGRCEIALPLSRRTRNHLRSMYFGALCTGADAAAALIGLKASEKAGGRVAVIFKDMRAEFFKRAEADVHFSCEQGREISELIAKADVSGERQNLPVHVVATVPKLFGSDPVARFTLTLSVKRRETAGPGHNRGREG